MVDAGEFAGAKSGEKIGRLGLESWFLLPAIILPPDSRLGYFLNVGDRIEIGGNLPLTV